MALEFANMSRRGQWGVIFVLCAGLLVVFYIYIWQGNQQEISNLDSQIGAARLEIERTRAVAERLPELQARLDELEGQLEILSSILPEARETDELLRRLQAEASASDLNVMRTAFQDEVPLEFYAEAPFELELTGTYHNLARFFERISKFARIVNVDEVNIQALEEVGEDSVKATCTAKTFFFIEEEVPVGAEAAESTPNLP